MPIKIMLFKVFQFYETSFKKKKPEKILTVF